jgi:TolB-like protein
MDENFSPAAIRHQLGRILQDDNFPVAEQRREFLRFVVEETLEGRGKQLKGVIIAQSVFGRNESFDPQNDPVVRLEARRLRSDLDRYYAGAGRWDAVRISIPKGGYTPKFESQETQQPTSSDPALTPQEVAPKRSFTKLTVAVVVLLLMILPLSWYLLTPRPTHAEMDIPKGPVIAVLPFLHLSEDPKRAYFTQGITQQLTSELVRFRDLWVLPLGTIQRLNSTSPDPQKLAEDLGAEFILEGSVLEKGETLSITARLIDLNSGRYIWVRNYDSVATPVEIYAVQDEIVQDVVGNLAGKYGILAQNAMSTAKRKAPKYLDTYDCVLQYYSYQISISLEQHPQVKACLERATRIDPDYSEAWAVLSNLYMQEVRYKLGSDSEQSFIKAKHAVNRAIELDPESSAAHLMLANLRFTSGDISGFRAAGETAISLNPNNNTVLAHYGMRLAFSGSWEEGLALVERAKALNPVHPQWFSFPEVFYRYHRREYKQALVVLDTITMPDFFWVQLLQAACYGQLGDTKHAQDSTHELLELKPGFVEGASAIIQTWQLGDDFDRHIKEGLRKAGLVLPTGS